MSKSTKIVIGIVIAAIAIGGIWYGMDRKPVEKGTIKIGAILSLTGDAANWGDGELKAIQMAIDEENQKDGINGKEIKLITEDVGTLNETAGITALEKLVNIDGVKAIIGPTWDMPGVAIAAENKKIILISPDSTEGVEQSKNLQYFFSTWHPQAAESEALAKFAERKNYKKIVILRDDQIFSQTVANSFIKATKDKNIEILDNFIILIGSKDFRTELIKIKKLAPDAILATFASEEPRGPLLRQIKELGLNIVVLGTASVENQDLLKYASFIENLIFYTYPAVSEQQLEFAVRFKEKYEAEPATPGAPNAYDAAKILITVLKQGAANSEEIRTALQNQEFPSVTFGKLKFNDMGFVSSEFTKITIKTIKNGQFVPYEE